MQPQSFKNHTRYVPLFHVVTFGLCLGIFILGCVLFFREMEVETLFYLLIAIVLLLQFYFIRLFPLKAQDRAIRAEENLRYFSLTGKLLDEKLTMSQIIALRFAHNDELLLLVEKTLKENLSANQIKSSIQHWKADLYRV